MYCTQCGARVDGKRFCSQCGTVVAAPPPPPPPPRLAAPPPPPAPGSFKGRLVTLAKTVNAPIRPELGYVFGGAVGTLLVVLGLSLKSHSHRGVLYAGLGLYACFTVAVATVITRIPRTIKIYEFGIEVKLPRGFNKSAWLPWSAVTRYEWNGDVIRYAWEANSLIVLSRGQYPSSWPISSFPDAARIPPEQASEVAGIVRQKAPPPSVRPLRTVPR